MCCPIRCTGFPLAVTCLSPGAAGEGEWLSLGRGLGGLPGRGRAFALSATFCSIRKSWPRGVGLPGFCAYFCLAPAWGDASFTLIFARHETVSSLHGRRPRGGDDRSTTERARPRRRVGSPPGKRRHDWNGFDGRTPGLVLPHRRHPAGSRPRHCRQRGGHPLPERLPTTGTGQNPVIRVRSARLTVCDCREGSDAPECQHPYYKNGEGLFVFDDGTDEWDSQHEAADNTA